MKTKNSKLYFTILLITLIFAVPIIMAKLLLSENIKFGHTNKGDLILPPISLKSIMKDKAKLNNTWKIAYLSTNHCEKACQQKLLQLRKLQIALAKNMNRVQPVLITFQQQSINKKINQVIVNKKLFENALQNDKQEKYTIKTGVVFLIDPYGNLMMSYRANAPTTSIFKDIQHLLKASKVG